MRQQKFNIKKCEKCFNEYIPKSTTQKWCNNCLTKICIECNNPFHIGKKTRFDTSIFCSRKCMGEYRSKNYTGKNGTNYKNGNRTKTHKIICSQCGNEAYKEGSQIGKWKTQFCKRDCQKIYYQIHSEDAKGEKSPIYSKVNVDCEWCGRKYKTYFSTKDVTRFCSKPCRNNWQSDMMKGDKHHNWNGGSTNERALDMISREYKNWRIAVFKRDKYTCKSCGDSKGGNLNAHHIKEWAKYPNLRHEIDNGITLCECCHIKVHSKRLDIQSELVNITK